MDGSATGWSWRSSGSRSCSPWWRCPCRSWEADVELVRELLDNQIQDRQGAKLGKVDGVVLELREGRPPRVIALHTGAVVVVRRLDVRLARWLARAARKWPVAIRVTRIPWGRAATLGREVRRTADAEDAR